MATRSGFSGIKPPSPLDVDNKTIRDTWCRCKQQGKDYCIVQGTPERPPEFQVSLFRIAIGCDAVNVLEAQPTLIEGDTELSRNQIDTPIKMMDKFVLGQVNPTFERHLLRQRTQKSGESIETLITNLKTMIRLCEVPPWHLLGWTNQGPDHSSSQRQCPAWKAPGDAWLETGPVHWHV